jgi:hypothetical protein
VRVLRVSFFICLLLTSGVFATDNSFKLDFNGDGRTDLALYREGSRDINVAPQPSYWYFLDTFTGRWGAIHWGRTLDIPAPADYDGDGITDVGIFRWWDFDTGDVNQWWLNRSSGGHQVLIYEPGYNKFNRNYIGDARAEIGQLYQTNISQDPTQPCFISVYFIGDLEGNTIRKTVGDTCNVNPTPVPGDYNNDGHSEIAVFNNHTFKVWFPPYNSAYTAPNITQFLNVDIPAPGDYDGDGKTDFAGTKARDGRLIWIIKQSSNGVETETDFGYSTDKPVPGDYDGDGKTDIAVWRASDGGWWIIYSASGIVTNWYFGLPTDTPLASPVISFDPSFSNQALVSR